MKIPALLFVGVLLAVQSWAASTSSIQKYLRITELMYNPSPLPAVSSDAQSFEFVKLKNVSTNLTLSLEGVRFTNGITFSFTGSAVTSLGPNQTVYIVRNKAYFLARYGAGKAIAGEYTGALDNKGENLTLVDASDGIVLKFAYDPAWFPITAGAGFSLAVVNEQAATSNWADRANWWPGVVEPASSTIPKIIINEVLAHTDPPDIDSIELYNPTSSNVDIGGWYLTDSLANPRKYKIPSNTVIQAGGYKVFYADYSFGLGADGFLLSEYGEPVFLFSGDTSTNLTGYCHGFESGESPNGISLGRYVTSQGREELVLQKSKSLGAKNSGPLVGPVVISKVMYNPPDFSGTGDSSVHEFIELQNTSVTNVPLYCLYLSEVGYGFDAMTNTWHLSRAVDYAFPQMTTLAAGAKLLVVSFDPSTNATQVASFRSRYGFSNDVPIFGPWTGKLDNNGEPVELRYPDKPDITPTNIFVPYVLVERVAYNDCFAWPVLANGYGAALSRVDGYSYGNDPTNWTWSVLSKQGLPDSDGDGIPDWWEIVQGMDLLTNDASLDPDQDGMSNYQEYLSGTDPKDANSVLRLQVMSYAQALKLTFQAMAGVDYSVQTNSTLDQGGWGTLIQVKASQTNRWTIINDPIAPLRSQFYRVITPAVP